MTLARTLRMALVLLAFVVIQPREAVGSDDTPEHLLLSEQAIAAYGGGRFQEAIATAKLALAASERATGMQSKDTADQVWNVGRFQEAVGAFAEADAAYGRALRLYEKHAGRSHPYIAEVLMATARVRAAQGRFEEARKLFLEMVAILEPLAEKEPALGLQLASYLAAGASIYELLNERDEAERLLLRALGTFEAHYGTDDVRIGPVVSLLGKLYHERGEYARALEQHQRSLALSEQAFGRDSVRVAGALANVATDLHGLGRMAEAQRHYQRALALHTAYGDDRNEPTAALLANYCAFLRERGDTASAVAYCQRAVAAFDAIHAEGYGLGLAIGHLGGALVDLGNYTEGVPHLQRSLQLRRKFWGDQHPMVGYALISLASTLGRSGKLEAAKSYAQQATDVMLAAYGPDHHATADALEVMALLREPNDRLELLERTLKIRQTSLGEQHPHVARSWFEVAQAQLARGAFDRARDALARCNAIREANLTLVLGVGSEMQKSQAVDLLTDEMGATITLHLRHMPQDPTAARLAFDTILQRKGRAVDALVSDLGVLRERATPEDRELLDELAATRAKLANLLLHDAPVLPTAPHAAVSGGDPLAEAERRQARGAALRSSMLTLEQRVAERSGAYRRASRRSSVEQVRAAIPSDAALVELVAYWPQGWEPSARRQQGHFRYAAYVLRSDGVIRGIDLGPVPTVNAVVASLRGALASRDGDPEPSAKKLYELVVAPARPALGDATRIFLSADGPLTLVPFAALIDEAGKPLIQRYLFTYLAGARELAREPAAGRSDGPAQEVVLVGAPAFGAISGGGSRAAHPLGLGFPPLAGARGEVDTLASTLEGATTLIGEAASEAAMKSLHGPRVLHVATHGFFVAEQTARPSGGARGVETVVVAERNDLLGPLLRSGLAFAGANDGGQDGEDGVLTAMEAASLDLGGTELVVLSACETGVGATSQGDGVRGLRRSLSIAGAETQMMSLWKVDDEATRELMVGYYDQLAAGAGRSAALRNVQLAMLSEPATAHPYYWAGFIVSGSDAPLKLKKRAEPTPPKVVPGQRGCACEVRVGAGGGPGWPWGLVAAFGYAVARRSTLRRRQARRNCPLTPDGSCRSPPAGKARALPASRPDQRAGV